MRPSTCESPAFPGGTLRSLWGPLSGNSTATAFRSGEIPRRASRTRRARNSTLAVGDGFGGVRGFARARPVRRRRARPWRCMGIGTALAVDGTVGRAPKRQDGRGVHHRRRCPGGPDREASACPRRGSGSLKVEKLRFHPVDFAGKPRSLRSLHDTVSSGGAAN